MNPRTNAIALRGAVAVAMLAHATAAEAQRATARRPAATTNARQQITVADGRRTGFVLGVYTIAAPGVTLTGDDMEAGPFKTAFGPGGGVMVGYGFNRTFTGYASADVAKQSASYADVSGSFGLRHLEVGARANLPYGDGATVPYVNASFGSRALAARVQNLEEERTFDFRLSGRMFGVGGGVEHVLSPTLAMDGGLEIAFGRFGHAEIDGESGPISTNGTTSMRLRVGMTWRPAPRRS